MVRRRASRLSTVAVLGTSLFTPLVSPFGADTYRYVWNVATSPEIRALISEWGSLWTFVPAAIALTVAAAVGLLAVRRTASRVRGGEVVTIVVFTGLAIWSARNVTWWGLLAPVILCGWLAGWNPGTAWTARATRIVAIGVGSMAAIAIVATLTRPAGSLLSEAPQGVTEALAKTPPSDRIFNEWWGSWFEYALPDRLMFADARVELFPPAVWQDYFTVVDARAGWQAALRQWNISTIVLNLDHQLPLRGALEHEPCWELTYDDGEGAIYQARAGCA
jgi:hypothetical protein